jgi:putative transposase
MRDNDVKFRRQFDDVFKTSGVEIKRTVPMSPNLRAHVERFIQTLKFECLNKFVIVAEKHLDHICRIWRRHYNEERPHSSRNHLPPTLAELRRVTAPKLRFRIGLRSTSALTGISCAIRR